MPRWSLTQLTDLCSLSYHKHRLKKTFDNFLFLFSGFWLNKTLASSEPTKYTTITNLYYYWLGPDSNCKCNSRSPTFLPRFVRSFVPSLAWRLTVVNFPKENRNFVYFSSQKRQFFARHTGWPMSQTLYKMSHMSCYSNIYHMIYMITWMSAHQPPALWEKLSFCTRNSFFFYYCAPVALF